MDSWWTLVKSLNQLFKRFAKTSICSLLKQFFFYLLELAFKETWELVLSITHFPTNRTYVFFIYLSTRHKFYPATKAFYYHPYVILIVCDEQKLFLHIHNCFLSLCNRLTHMTNILNFIHACHAPLVQGYVQPRKNGAKRLLNGNGGALNTLFWWRKCYNYGSWEGHSLCSFWRILGAWWNRYKYVFNTAKYARCYSHCPSRPE